MDYSQAILSQCSAPWLVRPATAGSPAWAVCPSLHVSTTCKQMFRGQASTARPSVYVYLAGIWQTLQGHLCLFVMVHTPGHLH